MSWNIDKTGSRKAIKHFVQTQGDKLHVPKAVQDAIVGVCDDVATQSSNGIRVAGFGHQGGGYGSIGKLEVMPVDIEAEPIDPAPVACTEATGEEMTPAAKEALATELAKPE